MSQTELFGADTEPSPPLVVVDPFNLAKKSEAEQPEYLRHVEQIAILNRLIDEANEAHEKALKPLEEKLASYKGFLLGCCPHPQDKIERRSSYIEGGYLDRSQSTRWVQCTVCGAESEKVTEFGGFN